MNDTKMLPSCKTFDEAIARAKHNINHFNNKYDRDMLMYWRGVLRGLEHAQAITQEGSETLK